MPHGCWIDLFGAPDSSGERRRVFGPTTLDAFVWRRYGDADRVSFSVGPSATVRLAFRAGPDRALAPRETIANVAPNEIVSLTIARVARAPSAVDSARTPKRSVVRRDVGDPPAARRVRRALKPEADAPHS